MTENTRDFIRLLCVCLILWLIALTFAVILADLVTYWIGP